MVIEKMSKSSGFSSVWLIGEPDSIHPKRCFRPIESDRDVQMKENVRPSESTEPTN